MENLTIGQRNLAHVSELCEDPDCELHHPEVIEDSEQSLTARAWFLAGAYALMYLIEPDADPEESDPNLSICLGQLMDQHALRL